METAGNQTATISFFKYSGHQRFWGMKQWYVLRRPLKQYPGLKFYKLFGTGSGHGFNLFPDWNTYGMFTVWENQMLAEQFLASHIYKDLIQHSIKYYTVLMHPLNSKGTWSGFEGWIFSKDDDPDSKIASLTCATINPKFLIKFWRLVPKVFSENERYPGLIFSKGFGEYPLTQLATFSIWESLKSMQNFAYKTFHSSAITETRKSKGFKEEMFTRFAVKQTYGNWFASELVNHIETVK
jgi:spheroidene monooxygenase